MRGEVAQAVTSLGTVQVTASDLEDSIVYNTKPRPVNDTVLVVYVPRSMWETKTDWLRGSEELACCNQKHQLF